MPSYCIDPRSTLDPIESGGHELVCWDTCAHSWPFHQSYQRKHPIGYEASWCPTIDWGCDHIVHHVIVRPQRWRFRAPPWFLSKDALNINIRYLLLLGNLEFLLRGWLVIFKIVLAFGFITGDWGFTEVGTVWSRCVDLSISFLRFSNDILSSSQFFFFLLLFFFHLKLTQSIHFIFVGVSRVRIDEHW